MSEYYNPIENKVHISEMELLKFVKEYLNYLLNEVNLGAEEYIQLLRIDTDFPALDRVHRSKAGLQQVP